MDRKVAEKDNCVFSAKSARTGGQIVFQGPPGAAQSWRPRVNPTAQTHADQRAQDRVPSKSSRFLPPIRRNQHAEAKDGGVFARLCLFLTYGYVFFLRHCVFTLISGLLPMVGDSAQTSLHCNSFLPVKMPASRTSEWDNWFWIRATSEDEISARPAKRTLSTSANWALARNISRATSARCPRHAIKRAPPSLWRGTSRAFLHNATIAIFILINFSIYFKYKRNPIVVVMLTSGLFSRNGEKIVSTFVFVFYRRQLSTINNSAIISCFWNVSFGRTF